MSIFKRAWNATFAESVLGVNQGNRVAEIPAKKTAAKAAPPDPAKKATKKGAKKAAKKEAVKKAAAGQGIATSRTTDLVDEDALAKLSQWVAGGFATLSGLAAFFGIKDGNLDVLVREHPVDVLYIAGLVGGGVVLALLSSALLQKTPVRFWVIVVGCSLLVLLSSLVFANFASDVNDKPDPPLDKPSNTFLFWWFVVTVALLLFFRRTRTSLVAAGVVFSLIVVSVGLYGATKLAIVSKLGPSATQVVGKVVHGDKLSNVEVTVKANWLKPNSTVVVELYGIDDKDEPTDQPLGTAELQSSSTGSLDTSATFAVRRQDWAAFSLRTCSPADAESNRHSGCEDDDERAFLSSGDGSADESSLSATLVPADKGVTASFSSAGTAEEPMQVHVLVRHNKETVTTLGKAYLVPDAEGKLSWSATMPVPAQQAGRVILTYRASQTDPETGQQTWTDPQVLAKLRLRPTPAE